MTNIFLFPDILGYLAGLFMCVSFVPQAIKSIRTKDTKSLSLPTYLIYVMSCILWLSYGLALFNGPMILWNSITLMVAGMVLYTKIRYG